MTVLPLPAERVPMREILRRDPCSLCGAMAPAGTVDHIIPKARGGEDRVSNLCGCCGQCNAAKAGVWTLLGFLAARPFLAVGESSDGGGT